MPPAAAKIELEQTRTFLVDALIPHEEQEDREVFPLLTRAVGNDDVTAALHRTHAEIFHLVRFVDRLVKEIPEEGPGVEDLTDLRRVLYGLDAILRLHMAQEEELYLALGRRAPGGLGADPPAGPGVRPGGCDPVTGPGGFWRGRSPRRRRGSRT